MPRKQIHDIIDECYMVHSYEMAAKGKSLALSVAIPNALEAEGYFITDDGCVIDDRCLSDFSSTLQSRLSHWTDPVANPAQVTADVIVDIQNAGLLIRRRRDRS